LWISKKELERLKQLEQSFIKCMRRNSGEDCRYKEMQKNLVSLSDYYAERLEWWKGRFHKDPKPYQVLVNGEIVEFNERPEAESFIMDIEKSKDSDFIEVNERLIRRESINQVKLVLGHPDPYTDSEIESWVKEQLEQEMKGWRVVKEEPERLYKWHAMLTNISGD
jgi:hypothetical protein